MFSGLTPFTEYTVTIAAVDTMNREGVMTTRTVTTAKSGMNEWRVCVVSPVKVTITNPVLHITAYHPHLLWSLGPELMNV